MNPAAFRESVTAWLAGHVDELEPFRARPFTVLAEHVERLRPFHRRLYDAGFTRAGWPADSGGSGGSALLRGVLYDEILAAGYDLPRGFEFAEIIVPTLFDFAPHLARRHLPAILRGDLLMCQGFSEPGSGSDLGSLTTRAVPDRDGFRVTGQKTWIGNGAVADWCLLLARTGDRASRHRGLTMLWIDMTSPGLSTRPIAMADGTDELAELYLDDVAVPAEHVVGGVGQGWAVAMHLLQFERSTWAWQRQAHLLATLSTAAREGARPAALGTAFLDALALRALSLEALLTTAAGHPLGPASSVTKLVLSTAERSALDARLSAGDPILTDPAGHHAAEWFHARSTSVFGGAAEIQRDLVADRVLGLPRGSA